MAKLRFFNFLTRKVENFTPIDPPNVTLYTCGPTVYDFVHIGNWRTFIFEDVLRRTLEFAGYKLRHVMNITDIDDKIIAAARSKGQDTREFIEPFEKDFFDGLKKLNIKPANVYPKATEHIPDMIKLIEKLLAKGAAYKTDDGVYFDISKFPNYGKLSNLSKRQIKVGARIAADLYEKDNPADFALWKYKKPSEPSWSAPFGTGRPGWHIECSAMSMKYLGDPSASSGRKLESFRTIDIHTGAVDLLFPHHDNEIAQSEAVTSQKFVNYWLEGEHMLLLGQKISKSLGNIITLEDLKKKGFDPLTFRYLCLTANYRSKLNFTWESLTAAQNALNNLRLEVRNLKTIDGIENKFQNEFKHAINNDLDTPKALSVLWEVVKSDLSDGTKKATLLGFDNVFGLGLAKVKPTNLPKGAAELIQKRERFRRQGKWVEADKIRQQLKKMGVEIEDTEKGPKVKIKN